MSEVNAVIHPAMRGMLETVEHFTVEGGERVTVEGREPTVWRAPATTIALPERREQ